MVVIDNILVSDEVLEKQFVCDLSACKGGCCEEGDAGAPLEDEELNIIGEVFEKVQPYLTAEAIEEIGKKGTHVYNKEFGWVTPTHVDDNGLCVYAKRDKQGIIKCAFEQAYNDGVITWKKPVSCHLFPIIAKKGKHGDYNRVNYQPRETLCKPACALGQKLKVPVYQFLKEPLTRKFGEEFYVALEQVARNYFEKEESEKKINRQ